MYIYIYIYTGKWVQIAEWLILVKYYKYLQRVYYGIYKIYFDKHYLREIKSMFLLYTMALFSSIHMCILYLKVA